MERGLEPVKEDSEIPELRVFQIFQLVLISQGPSEQNDLIYIVDMYNIPVVPLLWYTVQLYEYFNLHVLFID
uniref:Uncharacterized protein n=1 Tax=Macaca fascicularis TaxID=9541 RepID=Q9GMQ8_MACFA|nr:hypothetical protein [Macaca fascicularis]